jgi:hypothetical protein
MRRTSDCRREPNVVFAGESKMNERIKELALVAERLAADELAHLERVHNHSYSSTESKEIYNQKFAQLIVAECADIADNADATREKWQSIGKFVREHFGVE